MPLPININELINGQTVEWERIELKRSWNPESILHSICAFANDINNWGGGYIIIGVEEANGKPILPPSGLPPDKIDDIQKKLLELCHKIAPNYFPIAVPVVFQNKHILIIWVPGGDIRPYKTSTTLGRQSSKAYYVRRFSSTVKASVNEEKQLFELAAKIPFDDRIQHHANVEDLDITLIRSFLKEVGSDLYSTNGSVSFLDLCKQMQIVRGPVEYIKPVNVGLMLFYQQPEKFFKGARIEVVEYRDDIGDRFTEKIFTGPIHIQLGDALRYIKNTILKEEVRKVPGQAKAVRFFNYPYEAVKEALANAIYHRNYEHLSAVEVNVRLDSIEILSFPGPIPPVDNAQLQKPRVVARDYRNRRIGDFLKELHLTEGRSTGIPKMRRAMKNNGSPIPILETDEDRSYFLTILPIHPHALKNDIQAEAPVEAPVEALVKDLVLTEVEKKIVLFCRDAPLPRRSIIQKLGHKTPSGNIKKALPHLLNLKILAYTIPDKPRSSKQKYTITSKGIRYLVFLENSTPSYKF